MTEITTVEIREKPNSNPRGPPLAREPPVPRKIPVLKAMSDPSHVTLLRAKEEIYGKDRVPSEAEHGHLFTRCRNQVEE
jgi:hypothetical protein